MIKYMDNAVRILTGVLYFVCVCTAVYGNLKLQLFAEVNIFVLCIPVVIIAGIAFLCRFTAKSHRHFVVISVIIFFTAFILRIIMIFIWKTEPVSDFKMTFDIASDMSRRPFREFSSHIKETVPFYYYEWPMHMPFILFEYFIVKIFGDGIFNIQVLSAFFGAASCFILCFIGKGLYNQKCGLIAGFLYAFLPVSILFTGVLSNQHIATFFFLTALYFIVCKPLKNQYVNLLLIGVSISVSHLMRPEMQVMAIAYVCMEIYRLIKCKNIGSKEIGGFFINAFVPVIVSLIIAIGTSVVITSAGLAGKSVMTGNLKYKIATGLNRESGGQWNEADMQGANNEKLLEKHIKERLSQPGLVAFMMEKLLRQYGAYDYSWCAPKDGKAAKELYSSVTNMPMLIIFLLILTGMIKRFKNFNSSEMLLMIMTIGYFLTFAIIEIQDRYNYFMIPVFILMACRALKEDDKCILKGRNEF